MPLASLCLRHTAVSDLTPLEGAPIGSLDLGDTRVSDLTPLKGMSLSSLNLLGTRVTDLSPLVDMELTEIAFNPAATARGVEVLREMDTIDSSTIPGHQGLPPQQFWQRYDAGEFKTAE
jgi:hypothetical protein